MAKSSRGEPASFARRVPSREGSGTLPGFPSKSSSYRRIYAAVSRIPKGRVATYGQIAAVARLPRQARLVGYAMHALPADSDVPWHRVVNAAGKISIRGDGLGHDELQAQLLKREGVRFVKDAIPLARYRWKPR
jgi:methylated-DNA-protein-cysteine methyltransferase-like protein